MEWLKEIEDEEEILGEIDPDEDESEYCEESNHNSDSEEDGNEDVEIDEHIPDNDDGVPYYLGKYKKIIQAVTQSTNIYIDDIKEMYERDRDAKPTDTCEIRALLGMLYLLGVCDVVKRLVEFPRGTYRNITMDNWFSSFQLAIDVKYDLKLTMLGTLRKNKREIPTELVNVANRPEKSYDKIDPESEKPMMIVDYNNTKYGVDVVDQMCASYSVARNSKRWSLTVFFNMMNIGGINAPVLYQLNNRNNPIVRREFLRTLALNLLKPYVNRRYYLQSIPRQLKQKCRLILGIEEASTSTANDTDEPKQKKNKKWAMLFMSTEDG
ncbi:hypothetical protein NQ314_005331 [Rhamnusium bicolor]|uniref:PiggyBac transposable element-derived protein domain-containing protein n=1 Tax=Rhamnusium bicolor TaxID=1586634 RepID=A0AAV8ZJG7_9CUCU|nr:hypothetical protein NQ314_005331 [Rhamnusium bicolor]